MGIFRTKSIEEYQSDVKSTRLKREMGALDVTLLGIGVIVGTGIFVLTGVAAAKYAGPALMISFLLVVMITLGYLLVRQAEKSMITLLQTRMLDISNTAAAMIDGDVMETVTPEDKGTEGYESIMRTLTYFQDNIDLKYM